MGVFKKLFSYVPEKMHLVYFSIFLSAFSVFLQVAPFWFLWRFFYELTVQKDIEHTKQNAILIILLMVSYGFVYLGALMCSHLLAFRLECNLRKEASRHLMRASFTYFDTQTSGKIRKVIDDNAAQIHTLVAHLIPDLTVAFLMPLCMFIVIFMVDYRLGILLLIMTAIGFALVGSMMGNSVFIARYMKALERMNSTGVEYVRGIQVVKIFGSKLDAFKEFYEAITSYAKDALEYSLKCRIPYVIFQVIFNILIIFNIPFAVLLLNGGASAELILAKIVFFASAAGAIFVGFMHIMYTGMYKVQAGTFVDTLEKNFTEMKEKAVRFGNIETMKHYDIEFKNVTFGYDEEMILSDLSFKLEGNKTYALVGSSGGGKSTIAKLISGFYPLQGGEILIGDVKLSEYSEKALMQNIAFVFQHSGLFKASIYENVLTGNPDAGRDEVLKALELARCNEFLEKFPDRENTLIGAKGVHLSGGEKQRIAIARAILKNAPIIILDEASAATDPENEYELQKAFANLIKNKTVIMIAHRLSSIRKVDEVLVVEAGRIAERGSHEELMELGGKYRMLQELYVQACDWRVYG